MLVTMIIHFKQIFVHSLQEQKIAQLAAVIVFISQVNINVVYA